MKLSIIVPAHNEEATIEEVVRRVLGVDLGEVEREVLVVDDASTDDTLDELDGFEDDARVVVLRHERNMGKGRAIRTGLEKVTGDLVVIQDADLEYRPEELGVILQPVLDGRADVVFGSRFKGRIENMAPLNRLANWILSWAATLLFFKRITDEATCYKLFRTDVLRSFDLECERFEFCPEVTAKTLTGGYRLVEVPITYRGRTVEAGKKIRATDGLQALWTLVRYRFARRKRAAAGPSGRIESSKTTKD